MEPYILASFSSHSPLIPTLTSLTNIVCSVGFLAASGRCKFLTGFSLFLPAAATSHNHCVFLCFNHCMMFYFWCVFGRPPFIIPPPFLPPIEVDLIIVYYYIVVLLSSYLLFSVFSSSGSTKFSKFVFYFDPMLFFLFVRYF